MVVYQLQQQRVDKHLLHMPRHQHQHSLLMPYAICIGFPWQLLIHPRRLLTYLSFVADNSVVTYGPDAEGYLYEITHSRDLNWRMSHDCQATVRRGMEKGMAEDIARVQVPTKAALFKLCSMPTLLCIAF